MKKPKTVRQYDMNSMLTAREVCHVIGISFPTLQTYVKGGWIKRVKTPKGGYRYPYAELVRFWERN